jgi:hypothetical protein
MGEVFQRLPSAFSRVPSLGLHTVVYGNGNHQRYASRQSTAGGLRGFWNRFFRNKRALTMVRAIDGVRMLRSTCVRQTAWRWPGRVWIRGSTRSIRGSSRTSEVFSRSLARVNYALPLSLTRLEAGDPTFFCARVPMPAAPKGDSSGRRAGRTRFFSRHYDGTRGNAYRGRGGAAGWTWEVVRADGHMVYGSRCARRCSEGAAYWSCPWTPAAAGHVLSAQPAVTEVGWRP